MKKITVALILFALVLTACASLGAKAKDEANKEPVIVFQRSGGFTGVSEQWSIYANGKIAKKDGKELTVEPAQVTVLLEALQAAGFYEMKASPSLAGSGNCNDCYTYQLTVTSGGKENSITVQEGAKDVPEAFWSIIKQIDGLIASTTTGTPYSDLESKASTDREKTPAGLTVKAQDAVIIYQRGGGLAGVNEQWYITASGHIFDNKGALKDVDAAQVTSLLDEFKAAGFFDLQDTAVGKQSNCKDCFSYGITVTLDGQTKTITTQDGAAGIPDAVWKAIEKLNLMIKEANQ
jgi:hypothetical protein